MDFFKFLKKDQLEDLDLSKSNEEEVLDLTKKDNGEEFLEKESFQTPEEKKKKLAKRLIDITEKLEDLSNQIYHLGQRVEVLEKKTNVNY
jgi:L-2-hydroxyglutarate oxidase LhgO